MRRVAASTFAFGLVLLVGCGEQAQTLPAGKTTRADRLSWQIKDNGYLAPGWTPGNQASWDAQLKKRAQGQNDFATPN